MMRRGHSSGPSGIAVIVGMTAAVVCGFLFGQLAPSPWAGPDHCPTIMTNITTRNLDLLGDGLSASQRKQKDADSACLAEFDELIHTAGWKKPIFRQRDLYEEAMAGIREAVSKDPEAAAESFEGSSSQITSQRLFYEHLSALPCIKTICEIGFNQGHSTASWLAYSANDTVVYSFDLFEHKYSPIAEAYLLQRFPGRLTITKGDSTVAVPKFHSEHPEVKCDLLIVDGGHSYEVAYADIDNMRYLANQRRNIFVMDDIGCQEGYCLGPNKATADHEANGHVKMRELITIHEVEGQPATRGFGVGHYLFTPRV